MPKGFSGQDRRRFTRIDEEDLLVCEPFNANSFGGHGDKRMRAFTKSLSEGGILFESDTIFELATLLRLEIDIPGWEKYKPEFRKSSESIGRRPLVVLGKVVRVEDVGGGFFDIGVAFAAVDEGHRMALKKYLERIVKEKGPGR